VRSIVNKGGLIEGALLGGLLGFFARDFGLLDIASAWVLGAALGVAVTPWRHGRATLLGTVVAAAVLWMAVAFTPVAGALAAPLVRRDAPRPADAVAVLASRLQRDGDPTPVALSRLLRALELLREGQAPRLVLTELPPPAPSHAAFARRLMERLGSIGEVLSVGPVRSTREEAVKVAALSREKGWKKLLVVTSPTHSRRACGAFALEVPEVLCVPAAEPTTDLETQDRPVERLELFRLAVHEWAGLLFYRAQGWLGPEEGRPAPAAR
jgi:uncharacterized SAM-binding protein YcdF (DUF218 family)